MQQRMKKKYTISILIKNSKKYILLRDYGYSYGELSPPANDLMSRIGTTKFMLSSFFIAFSLFIILASIHHKKYIP